MIPREHAIEPTASATRSGSDWLDEACWRCGVLHKAAVDARGRVLCSPCRQDLAESPDGRIDALSVSRRAYWESHVMLCCWRCMAGAVAGDDDLGLCSSCRTHLAPATAGSATPTSRSGSSSSRRARD